MLGLRLIICLGLLVSAAERSLACKPNQQEQQPRAPTQTCQQQGCTYKGRSYGHLEEISGCRDSDDCNRCSDCVCYHGMVVPHGACTEMACIPREGECRFFDKTYATGEKFECYRGCEKCSSCKCNSDGNIQKDGCHVDCRCEVIDGFIG